MKISLIFITVNSPHWYISNFRNEYQYVYDTGKYTLSDLSDDTKTVFVNIRIPDQVCAM